MCSKPHGLRLGKARCLRKSQGKDLCIFDLCKPLQKRIQNLINIQVCNSVDFRSFEVGKSIRPDLRLPYIENSIHRVREDKGLALGYDLELSNKYYLN